jgi:hypothetical protein
MNKLMLIPLAAVAITAGCATGGYGTGYAGNDYGYFDQTHHNQYGRYDYNNPDPRYGGYYADNYYRNDRRYRERVLSHNDRVYRGRDGRYYCRRSDGSTGLLIGGGAVLGGVAGNLIAPGESRTLGTILGAVGGAAVGAAVANRNNSSVRCR